MDGRSQRRERLRGRQRRPSRSLRCRAREPWRWSPACAADRVADLRPFHATDSQVAGVPASVSRTGYTGEDGFELYVAAADAPRLWDALLEAGGDVGLIPCGLGARDTLRLEAGLRLYGQDMDDATDPYSCALGWTVKLQKGRLHRERSTGAPRSINTPRGVSSGSPSRAGRSLVTGSACSSAARRPARSPAGPTASRSTTRSPPHHWTETFRRTPSSPSTSEAPSPRQRWCRCPSIAAPREPERGRPLQLPVHRQSRVGPRRGLQRENRHLRSRSGSARRRDLPRASLPWGRRSKQARSSGPSSQ